MELSDIQMTPLLAFFTTFGIFSFGYIISSITTAYISYVPLRDEIEDDETEYYNTINNNFSKLDTIDLSDNYVNELKNKFIREMTEHGDVILCYNNETESFNYWSYSKNIYFNTLEIVSKKYVTDYNCKKLYQYKVSSEEDPSANTENDQPTDTEDLSGNTDEQPGQPSQPSQSDEKIVFANLKDYNKKSKNNEEIVKNRYSYRGKIEDWNVNINKKTLDTNIKVDSSNNEISFKDYKKNL